jgi:hypothetical protein
VRTAGRWSTVVVALGAVVVLGGCRPEIGIDLRERSSKIDRVVVDASVTGDGVIHVSQRYTFEDESGGVVALPERLQDPNVPAGLIAGVRGITVDGKAVERPGGTFKPEVTIPAKEGTIAYEVVGAIRRWSDIADLQLDVLPGPENASRQDPNVALSGTLTLPEGLVGTVDAHFHGGRDRELTVDVHRIRFSSDAPIWQPGHKLAVAFPQAAVPGLPVTDTSGAVQFQIREGAADTIDQSTESTLVSQDTQAEFGRWATTAIAFGLPGIFWLGVVRGFVRRLRGQRKVVHDVPATLSDPPTKDDPAVVSVLAGEGSPDRDAVAGTILAMAHRKDLDVQEYGNKVVVKVPLATTATNGSEQIVLDALRSEANQDGVVEGPPVWSKGDRWWRSFRRDAVKRARSEGLVSRWLPFASLSGALSTTGVGASVFFFSDPWIYFILIFGAQIIGYTVSFISGYTLTPQGWRSRALWRSFGRYIHQHGKIDKDVGPAGVVVWGPYLAYGAVLGEAHAAARPLTP